MLTQKTAQQLSKILRLIAHTDKLCILCALKSGEKNVSDLLAYCHISQSQLSQFLSRMRKEEYLTARRDGREQYYSICDEGLRSVLESLEGVCIHIS